MSAQGPGFPVRDHLIPLPEAVPLTTRFRAVSPDAIRAYLFARSAFEAILGQPGCAGIRLYHAVKPDGEPTLVVVGTDAGGVDLASFTTGDGGVIAEFGLPCPPACSPDSPLNR